jgi:hypothetical protein
VLRVPRIPLSERFPVGHRVNRLTVTGEPFTKNDSRYIPCRCDCGNVRNVSASLLRRPNTFSCGCYADELSRARHLSHNDSTNKFYFRWHGMVRRCTAPAHKSYPYYGGRGIRVCDEWLDYSTFKAWAEATGFKDGLWLERIDNDGNYCPENCTWRTQKEQSNNRRNNVLLTFEGRTQTIAQWADETGINQFAIGNRLRRGWPLEDVLTLPVSAGNSKHKKPSPP